MVEAGRMRLDMYVYQGCSHVLFHSLRKQDALVSDPKGQLNLFAICRVLDCVSLSPMQIALECLLASLLCIFGVVSVTGN